MAKRVGKFVSAISAGLVVSAPLAAIQPRPLHAAEDCLSKPKEVTPPGQHWFYRVVRGSNRRCWYLHEATETSSHTSMSRRARRSAIIAARKSEPQLTSAAAEAHAELGLPPSRGDEVPPASQQTLVASDYPKDAGQGQPDNVIAETPQSLVSSRWPEPTGVTSAAGAPPPSAFVVATITPDATVDQGMANQGKPNQGKADLTPTPPPIALTTAEASTTATPTSLETLFLATIGAMTLTGFAGSSVYVVAKIRRRPRSHAGLSRGAAIESVDHTRLPSWLEPPAVPESTRYVGRGHGAEV